MVKRDLTVEAGATEGHASYILEQTIDIALRVQDYNHRIRVLSGGSFTIKLKHDGTKVYSKADRARAVSAVTESGLRMISVVEGTVGFDGETYWKVSHLGKGETLLSGIYYVGYIHDDDVDWAKGS